MKPGAACPASSGGGVHAGRSYSRRNSARSWPDTAMAGAPRRAAAPASAAARAAPQAVGAHVVAAFFLARELDAPQRAVELRVGRGDDERVGRRPLGERHRALLPQPRDVRLPGLAKAQHERVGPAEQEHRRAQRVPPRQHGQVLEHDGVVERRHQFLGRNAPLLEAVDVGLREDAALARDRVDLEASCTRACPASRAGPSACSRSCRSRRPCRPRTCRSSRPACASGRRPRLRR